MCDLVFVVDLTSHLNALNINLQRKNSLIANMIDEIRAFMNMLRIWRNQIEGGDLCSFLN